MTSGGDGIQLRILGPLEVRAGGDALPLAGGKQRTVLALLSLRVGEVVSSGQLVDELWGESPPSSAAHTLEVYVSRLRQLFNGHGPQLVRRGSGYVLELGDADLDARHFVELAQDVSRAAAEGDHDEVATRATEALGLWRGRALADVELGPHGRAEADGLEELRLRTQELRIDAELALGRHEHAVGELRSLVARNAYRERFVAQLMLALYRSGRHAEALAVYEQLRRRLDDDLGLQPSADLQQLSARMVRQEQELDIAGPTHAERAPSQVKVRARRVSGLVAAGAAAAAVMALTAAGGARQLEATGLQPARIAVVLERPRSTDRYAAWRADEVTSAVGGVSSTADADAELLHVGGDPQPSEVARVSRRLAAERFDLVLFALSTHAAIAFAPVVAELPRTRSVFIDTTLEELALAGEPNATAIRFATEGPAQLAGALSGLIRPRGPTSERPDTVSVLVSDREPEAMRVVTAFRRGVVRARPNATVRIDYTSETFDPTACEHAANAQIDAGADVVFVHSGHCGTGALAVARARGVPTISGDGVSGPEGNVLASIFKDWDNAVYSAVGAFKSGVLPRGENVVLSLDGYNVGLDMNATLPKGIASKVVNLCTDVRLHVAKPSIPTLAEP